MFRLFGRSGWDRLPTSLLERVKLTLGKDFEKLNELAEKHGLFRQEFFQKRDYDNIELQLDLFAFLIGSLGNQLGQQEKFVDAETAFNISLKLKPAGNPAITGLANLYALTGNLEKANLCAEEGLEFLWFSPEMRTSDSGRMLHVQLANIVAETHLQEVLGQQFLDKVRGNIKSHRATSEQKQRLALACLEIGGFQHEEGLVEYRRATADMFFDAADKLAFQQIQRMQNQTSSNPLTARMQEWENLAHVGDAAAIALAATKLDPQHIDAWVLASNLRGMGAMLGAGFESQAFELSLEALERIDRYLLGDNTLYSKDPALTHRSGNISQITELLIQTLQAHAGAGAEQLQQRASKYLG